MVFTFFVLIIAFTLFVGMIVLIEVGRRLGLRRLRKDAEATEGLGAADGAIFALLGLLIAFTFSGAAGRARQNR